MCHLHPQQAQQLSAGQCDNPERRARRRKDSRRCLSAAVVNPHHALDAYMSLAIMKTTRCQSASSLQDGFDGLEVCLWCRSSLSQ